MPQLIKKVLPLAKWVMSGGLAVLVDLLCLYIFVEFFGLHYILAASVAFFISASTNYTISRFVIFKNAQHSTTRSYSTFMSISLFGLAAIALGMFVLVDIFHVHYLVSRLFLAGTLGVSSFFLHKYISFKDTTKLQ
jgi:putative flippase GtrA